MEEPKKITKTKQAKGDVADVKGTQPAKYYSKDADKNEMSKFNQEGSCKIFSQRVDDDPKAYKPALVIKVQRLNHLSIPKSSNRCMVNKIRKKNTV